MKWLFYVFLVILSGALFLPSPSGEPRNLPLLIVIVSVFVAFWFVRFIRTFIFACKASILLKKNSFKIKKLIVFFKTAYIIAENDKCTYSISMYRGINQKYRYHFEKPNVLEIYKTTRTTFSAGRRTTNGGYNSAPKTAVYNGAAMTTLAKKKKFLSLKPNTTKEIHRLIVMSDFPTYISDSVNDFSKSPIGQGDVICKSETQIYSLFGLKNFFKSYILTHN